ncbi:proteasome subunit alpha type-3-like isoform X2 [Nerophis ophidion]|uniref:proteasome subunit alpha type-3-like isoform X2 n=1 Tax=Nerophis ophidion TaxID=159077 RepID=UPI002ADF9D5D|nr:proteasome subunit alpha type-3-like isoform X2 [Nerophis ophidion]
MLLPVKACGNVTPGVTWSHLLPTASSWAPTTKTVVFVAALHGRPFRCFLWRLGVCQRKSQTSCQERNCSTAIGIRCKDGVVFGVEKLVLSKLYEEGSNKHIFNIDRHVCMWRGLLADARSLAEVAREEASNYGHDIPLKASRRRVVTPTPDAASCQSMWPCTCTPTPRTAPCDPFGCSFILRSHNKDDDLQLYMADPSGVSYGY